MPKKRQRSRKSRVDMQRLALQRTLTYLTAIRPGVPIPASFIEGLVSGDVMMDGPHKTVLENLVEAPALFDGSLEQLFQVTMQDSGRATITVTAAQLPKIHQALRDLGPDQSWAATSGLGEPFSSCTTSFHLAAAIESDEYSPDQLALLASHGLYWLEHELADASHSGAYGAAQVYDALWLLYDEEAIALGELAPLAPRVVEHCERYAEEWGECPPFMLLTSFAEGIIESGETALRPWAERAFALADRLVPELSGEEREYGMKSLKAAHERAGL